MTSALLAYNNSTDKMRFATNALAQQMVIDVAGNVGIRTIVPAGLLHVSSDTAATGLTYLTQANASADAFDINFRKARGTGEANPTVITTADELGVINFTRLWRSGWLHYRSRHQGISSGTIADSSKSLDNYRSVDGTNAQPSVSTEANDVDNAGNVGIGTTGPE